MEYVLIIFYISIENKYNQQLKTDLSGICDTVVVIVNQATVTLRDVEVMYNIKVAYCLPLSSLVADIYQCINMATKASKLRYYCNDVLNINKIEAPVYNTSVNNSTLTVPKCTDSSALWLNYIALFESVVCTQDTSTSTITTINGCKRRIYDLKQDTLESVMGTSLVEGDFLEGGVMNYIQSKFAQKLKIVYDRYVPVILQLKMLFIQSSRNAFIEFGLMCEQLGLMFLRDGLVQLNCFVLIVQDLTGLAYYSSAMIQAIITARLGTGITTATLTPTPSTGVPNHLAEYKFTHHQLLRRKSSKALIAITLPTVVEGLHEHEREHTQEISTNSNTASTSTANPGNNSNRSNASRVLKLSPLTGNQNSMYLYNVYYVDDYVCKCLCRNCFCCRLEHCKYNISVK